MADHRIDAAPDTVHWGYFDAKLKPLITVTSGDTVTISTVSGMASQMPAAPYVIPKALAAIQASVPQKLPGHICTGPVAVKGSVTGQMRRAGIPSGGDHPAYTTRPSECSYSVRGDGGAGSPSRLRRRRQ